MDKRALAEALRPAAKEEAELEARFLLEEGRDEAWLKQAVTRRLAGEPLQYILGEWEFMGLPFFVGPEALIPRQDTETLCEAALAFLKFRPEASVLDLCCGTGCVGVSLKKLGGAQVTFSDISAEALALAKKNAARNGVEGIFLRGDLLENVLGDFDLITCNPPYLTEREMGELQRELTFEPALALYGDADGLSFYRRLAKSWAPHVKAGGLLLMEIGSGQGEAVKGLFPGAEILKDIRGLDRVAAVKKA